MSDVTPVRFARRAAPSGRDEAKRGAGFTAGITAGVRAGHVCIDDRPRRPERPGRPPAAAATVGAHAAIEPASRHALASRVQLAGSD
ncbi:hypothetical protein [Rugosimonospora africana]|uniref:hypothetical protein n=1 Tax=Rugosimonospora africana TaxID=556532 RepID=UPI0019441BB3|nr:hypothetical protein [Rugosimonospora africana]